MVGWFFSDRGLRAFEPPSSRFSAELAPGVSVDGLGLCGGAHQHLLQRLRHRQIPSKTKNELIGQPKPDSPGVAMFGGTLQGGFPFGFSIWLWVKTALGAHFGVHLHLRTYFCGWIVFTRGTIWLLTHGKIPSKTQNRADWPGRSASQSKPDCPGVCEGVPCFLEPRSGGYVL